MNSNNNVDNNQNITTSKLELKTELQKALEDFALKIYHRSGELVTVTSNFPPDCNLKLFDEYDPSHHTYFEEPTLFFYDKITLCENKEMLSKKYIIYGNKETIKQKYLSLEKYTFLLEKLNPQKESRKIDYRDIKHFARKNIKFCSWIEDDKLQWKHILVCASRMRKKGSVYKEDFAGLNPKNMINEHDYFANCRIEQSFFSLSNLSPIFLFDIVTNRNTWCDKKEIHKNDRYFSFHERIERKAKLGSQIGGNCDEFASVSFCLALSYPENDDFYEKFILLKNNNITIKRLSFLKDKDKFDLDHVGFLIGDKYWVDRWYGDVVDLEMQTSIITNQKNPPLYQFIIENRHLLHVSYQDFIGGGLKKNHNYWLKKKKESLFLNIFIPKEITKDDYHCAQNISEFYEHAGKYTPESSYEWLKYLANEGKIKIASIKEFFEFCIFYYYYLPPSGKLLLIADIYENNPGIGLLNSFDEIELKYLALYLEELDNLLGITGTKEKYKEKIHNFFGLFKLDHCMQVASAFKNHILDIEMFDLILNYIPNESFYEYATLFKHLILCSKDLALVINRAGYAFTANETKTFLGEFKNKIDNNRNFDVHILFKYLAHATKIECLRILKDLVKKKLNDIHISNDPQKEKRIFEFIKNFNINDKNISLFEEIVPITYHHLIALYLPLEEIRIQNYSIFLNHDDSYLDKTNPVKKFRNN